MVIQFKEAHNGTEPTMIVVDPLALVALGVKRKIAPYWMGIRVECREINADQVLKPGRGSVLGVMLDLDRNRIVSADLS